MMRILLTGGTGFLGSNCIPPLLRLADADVHVVARRPATLPTGVVGHTCDLLDEAAVESLLQRLRPTHLLHCAWEATPVVYASSPDNLRWLRAGIALLDAFGRAGGRRFVGVGSSAEYQDSAVPCLEWKTPIAPVTVYGDAKAAMAAATRMAARVHGFSSAWARVFLPYGPGDPPQRLLPTVLRAIREGRTLALSDGAQIRDFVHAADVGEMLVRLLTSEADGPFNIGSGIGRSIRSVVEMLADIHQASHLMEFGAIARRAGDPPQLVADMARYEQTFGPPPQTPLGDGLYRL